MRLKFSIEMQAWSMMKETCGKKMSAEGTGIVVNPRRSRGTAAHPHSESQSDDVVWSAPHNIVALRLIHTDLIYPRLRRGLTTSKCLRHCNKSIIF